MNKINIALASQKDGTSSSFLTSSRNSTSSRSSDDDGSIDSSIYDYDGRGAMDVNDIAKMLGSVKFNEIETPTPKTIPTSASTPDALQKEQHTTEPQSSETNESLTNVLENILKEQGLDFRKIPYDEAPDDFFVEVTDDNIKAYTTEILNAVRSQDIKKLETMLKEGHCMQACNKFGESILHLACRRGNTDVVRFLIEKAQISINIKDDYGRTPMHDACWVSHPNFELVTLLIKKNPDLLLIKDKRGCIPLQYVKANISLWVSFLNEHKSLMNPKLL